MLAGWPFFGMLRRAAPLRKNWSAALATLDAAALGAAATQFVCPIDDPAHQLVAHLLPVVLLSAWGPWPDVDPSTGCAAARVIKDDLQPARLSAFCP